MIKSMTGFGRGECEEYGRNFTVEIRTINHRYSDISVKMPRQLSYLEDNIRKLVSKYISRGKVDVFISQDRLSDDDIHVSVDDVLAASYIKALHDLRDRYKLQDDITVSSVSRFPDLISVTRVDIEKNEIWSTLSTAIKKSLDKLLEMRKTEGQKLAADITERGQYIRTIVNKVEERSPVVVQEYKAKLEERIKEIAGNVEIDESRLAVEIAVFADRSSITEEIIRLYSHLDQLASFLQEDEPVGRKLDFLIQEMNREINTIGSKASDINITRQVVEAKSEMEKIREQIQNIE